MLKKKSSGFKMTFSILVIFLYVHISFVNLIVVIVDRL